jgi:ferredoxin-NADP reductase
LHKDGTIKGNKLIFANKTAGDIIYEAELSAMLGSDFINILSEENTGEYLHGHIDEAFLKKEISDFNAHFYVCGPEKMISDINGILTRLGAHPDSLVFEK